MIMKTDENGRASLTNTLPDFDLSTFTPYRAALAAQLLSEALAVQYRKRFNISIPDWRILVHLAHSGGASVRDIENEIVMEKSKVSRTASRLEARGLIAKLPHPDDKRLVHLSLTPSGVAMMKELLPLANQIQSKVQATLGGDFTKFDGELTKIIAAFGKSTS